MGKIKVTFKGQKGQIFSADGISFPAGETIEVEKLPKGVRDIKLSDGQRKSIGLKAGQSPFEIEGEEPKPKAATEKPKKSPTKHRGK